MNPFEVLGLPNNTPIAEVKKAFRKMSMTKHPDKGGNEDEYRKLLSAYSKISCGYTVQEKRKRVVRKENNKVTHTSVCVSINEAAVGCYTLVPVGNDYASVFIPPFTPNGQHLQFKGMGIKDKDGVNGVLDVCVGISLPEGFTFENYMGMEVLVYNVKFNADSIPNKLTISLFKRRKTIYLPKKLRDGMFLKVMNFGYPNNEPLFVRIGIK